MQYTQDILKSKVEENNVRMFELNGSIDSNKIDLDKHTMSFEKLEIQIGKCERSLSDLKDTDEIVIQSLSEKVELCRSEENRLCKIIEELQIYKEDYIYELSTLREENEDVKETLEMLENHSQKIEKEHIGVRGVKSDMLS